VARDSHSLREAATNYRAAVLIAAVIIWLAYNTSAAFSPTDTPVLSRRAKLLTMVQSVLSLIVIVVLVGWALNVL
jgi:hypothetical protein